MTYHDDFTLSAALLEQLSTQGLGALPDLFPVLLNAAMQIERQKHLGAAPHERVAAGGAFWPCDARLPGRLDRLR